LNLYNLFDYKLKIALLEDDPIILQDISSMLESLGHSVVATYLSGEAMLEEYQYLQCDLFVLDIELKGEKNGVDVAVEMQKTRSVPLIYLTSYSDDETVTRILKTDPYGFILKPARKDHLRIAINIAYYKFLSDKRIRESEQRYQSIVKTLPLMLARINPINDFVTFCNDNFKDHFFDPTGKFQINFFDKMEKIGFADLIDVFPSLSRVDNGVTKEYQVNRKDKQHYYKVICQALYDSEGSLFEYQFLCEDITRIKEREQKIQAYSSELDKRIRELKCLYSISRVLENSRNISKILQRVVDEVALALNDSQNVSSCVEYGVESFYSYNFFTSFSVFTHPIIVRGSIVGQIHLHVVESVDRSELFNNGELDLLITVSDMISKIVEKIEAEEQLKKLEKEIIMTSEREKQNLGHELHDGIGQILTGTSFILKSLENKLAKSGDVPQELTDVIELVKDATSKCRRLSKGLVPVSYSNETFVYLVEQLLHSTNQLYNVNFELDIPENFDIKNSFVTSQLYRIVQEAVNNTVKHADATKITLRLEDENEWVRLAISDNGHGLKTRGKDAGLGMNIMKYRADLIGANFDVIMEEKSGTTVVVRLPRDLIVYE
jgi:signal transduction histidine kinase/FixJ family two-component response regulator